MFTQAEAISNKGSIQTRCFSTVITRQTGKEEYCSWLTKLTYKLHHCLKKLLRLFCMHPVA